MFRMNATRMAANDGMNVKEFKSGQHYSKSELSPEIYEVYKQRGDLTDLEPETKTTETTETEYKPDKGSEEEGPEVIIEVIEVVTETNVTGPDPEVEVETEKNVLPNVDDLHSAKRKGGFK